MKHTTQAYLLLIAGVITSVISLFLPVEARIWVAPAGLTLSVTGFIALIVAVHVQRKADAA